MTTEGQQQQAEAEEASQEETRTPEEIHRDTMIAKYDKENSEGEVETTDSAKEEEEQSPSDTKEDSSDSKEGKDEKLPENFDSVDVLVESYKNLQKEHTRKAQELAELKKNGGKEPPKESVKAGDLITILTKDMIATGSVRQETADLFNEAGFTPEQFSHQVKTTQAYVKQATQEAYELTEGKEGYNEMLDWASENLSEQEIQIFNEQLQFSEVNAKYAIKSLYSQYKSDKKPSNGVKVGTGLGDTDTSGVKAFTSWDQVTKAMADPKYKSGDKDFQALVKKRLAKSNL